MLHSKVGAYLAIAAFTLSRMVETDLCIKFRILDGRALTHYSAEPRENHDTKGEITMSRITVPSGGRIRQGLLIGVAILSVVTMVQCSSGGGGDGGGTTTAPPTGRSYSQFAYTSNFESGTVRMFGIDSNGALVTIGVPLSAGGHPHSINVDPRGRFVYVSNEDDPANIHLSGYTINGITGILTPIPGPLPVAAGAQASVFDRSGNYLYVITGIAVSAIAAYAVDQTTGVLTQIGSSLPAGTGAHNLTVDPGNTFVYVASDTSNNILTYAIDQTNGVLTSVGPPVLSAFLPAAVAIHPLGAFAYVADEGDLVKLFTVDQTTGALTPNTVLPQTGATPGGRPHSIVIDTTGNFLYVGNIDTADISAWRIEQVTGELVALTGPPPLLNFATGIRPHSLAVTNGGFLYAANNGSDTISRFAINSTTGELTLLDTFDDPDPAVIEGPSGIGITNIP